MKNIRISAFILLLALLLAQISIAEGDRISLRDIMDEELVPEIEQIDLAADFKILDTHNEMCQIEINGIKYGCEFVFSAAKSIEDWSTVQQWMGTVVTEAARINGGSAYALAHQIEEGIRTSVQGAAPDESEKTPLWASSDIKVTMIRVSTPFYQELSKGTNCDATKALQTRLIQLGFLNDSADGYFGSKTKAAVELLQSYVRDVEQHWIDTRPTPTPEPTATPVVTAEPTAVATVKSESTPKSDGIALIPMTTATPSPTPTATPTPAPTATPEPMQAADDIPLENRDVPGTEINGTADAVLLAFLYSDEFPIALSEMTIGSSGADVKRLQTRLQYLGCSAMEPDGNYGEDTASSVRIFQHYNGLEESGVADWATIRILYSDSAARPVHSILMSGSKGSEVSSLQTRLLILGFGNISTDGDYGSGTQTAVRNLQEYIIETLGEATRICTSIDGIADPILQDYFYSADFPQIPETMQNGSSGGNVIRLQKRLRGLEYYYGSIDGSYGSGTASAVKVFQKRHGLSQTGIADAATLQILFSENALKALKPYVLKVSISDQRVYAYGLDDNNEHTVLVRTMKCSTGKTGTDTPTGTFVSTTGPGARWHYFTKFDCWAQYAYYIQGDIMFHSVLYNAKEGRVTQSSVNNLGRKASHGCVRLSVEDAKWIYENCPKHTKVIIY